MSAEHAQAQGISAANADPYLRDAGRISTGRAIAAGTLAVGLVAASVAYASRDTGRHDVALYMSPAQERIHKPHGWNSSSYLVRPGHELLLDVPLDTICTNGQSATITGVAPYEPEGDGNAKLEVTHFGLIPAGQLNAATVRHAFHTQAVIRRGEDSCDQPVPAHQLEIAVELVDAKKGQSAEVMGWKVETTGGSVIEPAALNLCDVPANAACPSPGRGPHETWGGEIPLPEHNQ